MSINRHVLPIGPLDLQALAVGRSLRVRSDKDLMVDVYSTEEGAPAVQPGVAQCPVTPHMMEDLREAGHTGIAAKDSPYIFGLEMSA